MSGVQPYCQTTSFGCLNNLEALLVPIPSKHSALGVILTQKRPKNTTFGVSSYEQNLNTLG